MKAVLFLGAAAVCLAGCATTTTSNGARTTSESQLYQMINMQAVQKLPADMTLREKRECSLATAFVAEAVGSTDPVTRDILVYWETAEIMHGEPSADEPSADLDSLKIAQMFASDDYPADEVADFVLLEYERCTAIATESLRKLNAERGNN